MRLGRLIGILVFITLFSFGTAASAVDGIQGAKRVVVLVIDRLSLQDLTYDNTPNLDKLIQDGAMGLLNTNSAGGRNPENTYATMGAGSKILASGTGKQAYNADAVINNQAAAEIFKQRTGINAAPSKVLQLGIAQIHSLNSDVPYPAQPGALGEALHQNNLKTAVLGNSDLREEELRQVVSIAMDKNGRVDFGNVSKEMLVEDPYFLGGYRTDYKRTLQEFELIKDKAQFIAIDLGDISRLEKNEDKAFESVIKKQRKNTLNKIDNFLGQVLTKINLSNDLLLIVSPTPSYSAQKNSEFLTPVIAAGNSIEPGLLSSPTTKRKGIVVLSDVAPTALAALNLNIPLDMVGRPLYVTSQGEGAVGDNSLEALQTLNERLILTYDARAPLLKGYVSIHLILLLISLYCIFWKLFRGGKFLKPFLLAVMFVPLVYLILPLFPQTSIPVVALELIIITILLTILSLLLQKWIDPFIIICMATALLILLDLAMGFSLQKLSILGYDPIMGARFYGIGNEYMGVLIGSSIIGAAALLSKFSHWRKALLVLIAGYFLIAIYLIGAPNFGTNVGGTIASLAAFLVTFTLFTGVKFNRRRILMLMGVVLFIVTAFIFYDLGRAAGQQSHIGRTAQLIANNGIEEIFKIISRKLEVNIRLIRYTIWSRIFLVSLGSLAILFYRPVGVMQSIKKKYPYFYIGFIGVITGSIVAFIFNDSGVVAAATTMIFGAPPLIYLTIQEKKIKCNGGESF